MYDNSKPNLHIRNDYIFAQNGEGKNAVV